MYPASVPLAQALTVSNSTSSARRFSMGTAFSEKKHLTSPGSAPEPLPADTAGEGVANPGNETVLDPSFAPLRPGRIGMARVSAGAPDPQRDSQ